MSSQWVSVKVQSVCYESQTGLYPHCYNPVNYQHHYTGRDLVVVCYVNQTIAIYWSMSQTGHYPHCYNPVNYQHHYTGRDLVWYVNQTIAIYWWMSQTEHDPHGYNPVNYTTPLHWARSRLLCQPDNSDLLINVSNRTWFTRPQSRELSTPLHWARSRLLYQPDNIYWSMSQTGHDPHRYNPMNYQHHHHWARSRFQCQPGNIYWSISMLKARSQFVCFNKTIILYTII